MAQNKKLNIHYAIDGPTMIHEVIPDLTRRGYVIIRSDKEIDIFAGSFSDMLKGNSSLNGVCKFTRTQGDLSSKLADLVYEADVKKGSDLNKILSVYTLKN